MKLRKPQKSPESQTNRPSVLPPDSKTSIANRKIWNIEKREKAAHVCRGGETRARDSRPRTTSPPAPPDERSLLSAIKIRKEPPEAGGRPRGALASWRRHHLFERNGAHSERRERTPTARFAIAGENDGGRRRAGGVWPRGRLLGGTHLCGVAAAPFEGDALLHGGRAKVPGVGGVFVRKRARRTRDRDARVLCARRPPHNNNRCASPPPNSAVEALGFVLMATLAARRRRRR